MEENKIDKITTEETKNEKITARQWWWWAVAETYRGLWDVYQDVYGKKVPAVAETQEEIDALLDVAEYIKDHESAEAAEKFVMAATRAASNDWLNKHQPDFVGFRKDFIALMEAYGYKGKELFEYLSYWMLKRNHSTPSWPDHKVMFDIALSVADKAKSGMETALYPSVLCNNYNHYKEHKDEVPPECVIKI